METGFKYGLCLNHNSMQLTSNPNNRGSVGKDGDKSLFRPLYGHDLLDSNGFLIHPDQRTNFDARAAFEMQV
jgi:hypothetical protein